MKNRVKPKISVLMPTLNQDKYIELAVRSVLQKNAGAVELVIADGGSSDETLMILERLGAEFGEALRWSSVKDSGPASAVNRAAGDATGDVLGWLNSDDLYYPGVFDKVWDYFCAHPDSVLVYGDGEHIDHSGRVLSRYPTLPPSTPIESFAEGCFICQPTAFFRREAFMELGGLDESFRASFDFDLWTRFFKRFPRRIGFLHMEIAQSRLHASSITSRMRETIAIEGLRIVYTQLALSPIHWLLSYLEELCGVHPQGAGEYSLKERFEVSCSKAEPYLCSSARYELVQRASADQRLRWATANLYVGVFPDGWAGMEMEVRMKRCRPNDPQGITLLCEQRAPKGYDSLTVLVQSAGGGVRETRIQGNGQFEIDLSPVKCSTSEVWTWRITSSGGFIPSQAEPGSTDDRRLSFLVVGYRLNADMP